MKRKIFSKLLMVAMLVASVSMFVSCKDYDDDIKKNSDAISSLQQTLNNLQSALDQAKSDAATAHATFATKVELGQVDTAVKALQEEIKALATKTALEDAIAKVNEAIGKNATKEELAELSSMVAAINTDLDAIGVWQKTTDDAIKTANENIGKQEEALAALALVVATGDQTNADAIAALKTALEKAIKDGDKANSDAIAALKTALEKSIAEGDNTNATAIAALEEVVGTKADAKALTDAVKELKEAIATKANQSALDALSKLVDAKATIASVDELKAALTEKIADAVTELENVKKTMATASDINDIKDAMKKADEAIKKNLDAINLLQVFIAKRLTSLVFIPDLYLDGIEAVEVLALNDTILALKDESKRGDVLELWGVKGINGHVTVPDSALTTWYYGVPSGDGPAYIQHGWDGGDDICSTFDKDETIAYYTKYPVSKAKYHVNPSKVNLDGTKLSFYVNTPEVVWNYDPATRAGEDALAYPVKDEITKTSEWVENGILTVPFSVNRTLLDKVRYVTDKDGKFEKAYDDNHKQIANLTGKEALIALQATYTNEEGNDTTVTSDYALLHPSDIEIVALGGTWMHASPEKHYIGDDHLWTKLIAPVTDDNEKGKLTPVTSGFVLYKEGAIDNIPYYSPIKAILGQNANRKPYILPIEYNTEGLDLSELITTHYRQGYIAPDGSTVYPQGSKACTEAMSAQMMEDLGLHYEFEAIHYISGSNKTDEFKHIKLTGEHNSIAIPTTVDDEGVQQLDKPAGRETIGRMPIVRVSLVGENDEVLAIGYILLEIVSTAIETTPVNIELSEAYMNCTAPAAITWAQVENKILAQVKLSKTEFEAEYYLETKATGDENLDGRFYSQTTYSGNTPANWGDEIVVNEIGRQGATKVTAVQYVDVDGTWTNIYDYNDAILKKYEDDIEGTDAKKRAAALARLHYPLGSVYETANHEGQQTTVLEWNVGSEVLAKVAGTMTYGTTYDIANAATVNQPAVLSQERAKIESGATLDSKGVSTKPIKVTVAYKKKNEDGDFIENGAIYVTLTIPAGKLHFAYAEVAGKDLAHWYQNNSYIEAKKSDESDAKEIHINVPTVALEGTGAALNGYADINGLQDVDFGKIIEQTFFNNLIDLKQFDKTNFYKFNQTSFTFALVAPKAGTNAATDITATKHTVTTKQETTFSVDDSWWVKGVTGNEYLVAVRSIPAGQNLDGEEIYIAAYKDVADGNKIHTISDSKEQVVVRLVRGIANALTSNNNAGNKNGTKIAVMPNHYAQDVINYTGRYNSFRRYDATKKAYVIDDLNTSYLDNENKTFTAFFEIKQDSPCYDMFMPNSFFKARFLRPINIMDKGGEWTDARDVLQTKAVYDLVQIKDWRGYSIANTFDDSKNQICGRFYGIQDSTAVHYWVDMADIRTDHRLGSEDRVQKLTAAEIEQLNKASEFESLRTNFLYLTMATKDGKAASETNPANILTLNYRNNEANVTTFHLYVPVYVTYSFGEFDYNGAEVFGTGGNASPMILKSSSKEASHFNYATGNWTNENLYTPFIGNRDAAGNSMQKETATGVNLKATAPLYTQKVWATIVVNKTTNSQPAAGARNK